MEYVHLIGSDAVERPGDRIASAAEDMNRAAGNIGSALHEFTQRMEDWVQRLERIEAAQAEREIRALNRGGGA